MIVLNGGSGGGLQPILMLFVYLTVHALQRYFRWNMINEIMSEKKQLHVITMSLQCNMSLQHNTILMSLQDIMLLLYNVIGHIQNSVYNIFNKILERNNFII